MLTGRSEYKMSLLVNSAQKEHSGRYSCVSPAGQSDDVILHVHTGTTILYSCILYTIQLSGRCNSCVSPADRSGDVILHVHTGTTILYSCAITMYTVNLSGRYSCASPAGQSDDVILHVHKQVLQSCKVVHCKLYNFLADTAAALADQ